jgi:tRNA-specific 2-thiouridylase
MQKILVGMSGGVDSAVTVHLLKKQGYQVTGVFLSMLSDTKHTEFKRAKILARQLDIELVQEDIQKVFQKEIISEFLNKYKDGLTPNPCISCNPRIKFGYLLQVADKLKIDKIATGHYAVVSKRKDKTTELLKGLDKSKDQSYFLYRLGQKELQRVEFPLGKFMKKKVKEIAKKNKLAVPNLESQDVCFLKGYKNLEEFLQKNLNKKDFKKGDIVDKEDNLIGKHQGLLIYTLGQRKGLNIGGNGPFYVTGKDFKQNKLIVSNNKQDKKICSNNIIIGDVKWTGETPINGNTYQIKIRYQMKSVDAKIEKDSNGQWMVECDKPIWAVAPGQSLVIYDGDKVIGGGIITTA